MSEPPQDPQPLPEQHVCPMCGEVVGASPASGFDPQSARDLLAQSRWAMLFVAAVFGAVALLTLAGMVYQASFRSRDGSWLTPADKIYYLGQLLRAFGGGAFAYFLWQVAEAVRSVMSAPSTDLRELLNANRTFWLVFAGCVGAFILYMAASFGYLTYLESDPGLYDP